MLKEIRADQASLFNRVNTMESTFDQFDNEEPLDYFDYGHLDMECDDGPVEKGHDWIWSTKNLMLVMLVLIHKH
jgi:hypothetical protein